MVARNSKITRKGQVTIPVEFRRDLDWNGGEEVTFERHGKGVLLLPAQSVTERTAGIGAKYRLAKPATREEEKEAFEQGVADEVVESMSRE
jgi:AbrB family looped-hinge helix DNA binding protein